ncbi:MAG: hypothetical protein HLUCCO16_16860 [Phormidium sp. OSCR]|nr:MAG: hypothetical protein HLUCCO16_16860 [Phormidium sp. OSCR]
MLLYLLPEIEPDHSGFLETPPQFYRVQAVRMDWLESRLKYLNVEPNLASSPEPGPNP